jgi:hypothetical protein
VWDQDDEFGDGAQNNAAAHLLVVSRMGCWLRAIAAYSADLRCGQLCADSCASKNSAAGAAVI